MSTIETMPMTNTEAMKAEFHIAVDRLINGTRDPNAVRDACERMDRMREQMRQRTGEVEIAVELIREVRDAP